MSSSFEKHQKRRLVSSYFSVVLSIALVLFLLGLLGLLVLNAKKVSDHFKEQVVVTIYLKDSAKQVETKQLEKSLAMLHSANVLVNSVQNFGEKCRSRSAPSNLLNLKNFLKKKNNL